MTVHEKEGAAGLRRASLACTLTSVEKLGVVVEKSGEQGRLVAGGGPGFA